MTSFSEFIKYIFNRPEIIGAIVAVIEAFILGLPALISKWFSNMTKKEKKSNGSDSSYIPGETKPEKPTPQKDKKIGKPKRRKKSPYPQYLEGTDITLKK